MTIQKPAGAAKASSPTAVSEMVVRKDRAADPGSFDAPPTQPAAPAARETFLDVVRALAIVRVIAWHAFGAAAITYVVAAMPAMFFVSGSLLAKSFGRRPARTVLADRFRRLLVPLWAFGLVAWAAMAVAAWNTGTGLPLHRALAWIFPLADPLGSDWEGGWLSSHLWYLRTVVWLFLLSPLLVRAVRSRPRLTFLVPVAAVFALDLLTRHGTALAGSHRLTWGVGDIALYSVFLMAGFLHRDGAFRAVRRRGWVAVALLAAVAAVVWRLTQPVPLGVVNNSHPLHLFVGAGWLAVALAVERPLARLGTSRLAGPAVRAIGGRALTIYLWHTAAIIVVVNLLESRGVDGPIAYPVVLVALTALGIVVAVVLFGWVEDLAARRRPAPVRRHPFARSPRPALAPSLALGTLVAVAGVVLVAPHATSGRAPEAEAAAQSPRRPPIPSKPPPAPTFEVDADAASAPEELTGESERVLFSRLDGLLERWADQAGVPGALVGLAGPTLRWSGATGSRPDTGSPVSVDDRIELASLTKLFTAALVQRYADQGEIDLSAPLPELRALPDFPYDLGITVEQLLSHTSGLVNYLDTDTYFADENAIDGPISGVMASVAHPLAFDPGDDHLYSSTNYLLLGLLLEDVSGRALGDLFREQLFRPLGLRDTVHRPAEPAWPRGGSSGIETSMPDLLTAGTGILRDHKDLSTDAYVAMTDVEFASGFGPGTMGFCPCRVDTDGVPHFFGIGYYGATTLLAYSPALDLTVAVDLVDSLGHNGGYDMVFTLFEMIEDLARAS